MTFRCACMFISELSFQSPSNVLPSKNSCLLLEISFHRPFYSFHGGECPCWSIVHRNCLMLSILTTCNCCLYSEICNQALMLPVISTVDLFVIFTELLTCDSVMFTYYSVMCLVFLMNFSTAHFLHWEMQSFLSWSHCVGLVSWLVRCLLFPYLHQFITYSVLKWLLVTWLLFSPLLP